MKNIITILVLLFFFSLLYSCNQNNITGTTADDKGLNFYLLKDSTLSANGIIINKTDISRLELSEKPFLSYKDIITYKWQEHLISLDTQKVAEINNFCKTKINVDGLPFIVKVNNERIYLGAFWFELSSKPSLVPYIEIKLSEKPTTGILKINKARREIIPDPRTDSRIYETLKKYNILQE